ASIGGPPQDLKFKGERTELKIGNDNVFREFVTINRGTAGGGGITTIANNNFFMAYSHVAHDCHIGNHTVFANNATLAGHVEIGYLGRLHARILTEIPSITAAGFVETNDEIANEVAANLKLKRFDSIAHLAKEVDAAVVATPTTTHYDVASELLDAGDDVMIV